MLKLEAKLPQIQSSHASIMSPSAAFLAKPPHWCVSVAFLFVQVWFYNVAWHSLVSFLSIGSNAILRGNLPAGEDPRVYGISVSNYPLDLTKEQLYYSAM